MREMLKEEYDAHRGFYNTAIAFLAAVMIGGALVVLGMPTALPRFLGYFIRMVHPGP